MTIAIEWPRVLTTPPGHEFQLPPLVGKFEGYHLALGMLSDPGGKLWIVNDFRFKPSPFSPLLEARLTVHRWGAQLRIQGQHIVDVAVTAARPVVRQMGEI